MDSEQIEAAVAAMRAVNMIEQTGALHAFEEAEPDLTGIVPEPWEDFNAHASDHVPALVDRLWAEAALGFIAGAPKSGKTWVGLDLAISVAASVPFLGFFKVPTPAPVLYVALEGHRAGLRARVGALTRGHNLDPDGHDLHRLYFAYKPPGINLADPGWARELVAVSDDLTARLIIVDVLRAAARIQENDASAFAALRANLEPLAAVGCAVGLLHHFGKLTEIQRDRPPGERMSGSGAMYGALDTGIYITGSERDGRRLRLAFDTRDYANPEHLELELAGDGHGPNGGLTYLDRAVWKPSEVSEAELKAPPQEIFDFIEESGGSATGTEIRAFFEISSETLTKRVSRLLELGVRYESKRGLPTTFTIYKPSASDPPLANLGSGDRYPQAEGLWLSDKDCEAPSATYRFEGGGRSENALSRENNLPLPSASPKGEGTPEGSASFPFIGGRADDEEEP